MFFFNHILSFYVFSEDAGVQSESHPKDSFCYVFFGIQKLAFAAFFGGFAAVQKSAKREPVASCFTQDILAQVPFVLVRI